VGFVFALGIDRVSGVLDNNGGQLIDVSPGPSRSEPEAGLALLMIPAVRGAVGVVLSPLLIGLEFGILNVVWVDIGCGSVSAVLGSCFYFLLLGGMVLSA
jgi:hypothetical protein